MLIFAVNKIRINPKFALVCPAALDMNFWKGFCILTRKMQPPLHQFPLHQIICKTCTLVIDCGQTKNGWRPSFHQLLPLVSATLLPFINKHLWKVSKMNSNHMKIIVSAAFFHTWYLSKWQNFWRIKFTPKKRVNYDKIHRNLPIFCAITAKYTVNCQFFALNL